jgi:hypothetical protein
MNLIFFSGLAPWPEWQKVWWGGRWTETKCCMIFFLHSSKFYNFMPKLKIQRFHAKIIIVGLCWKILNQSFVSGVFHFLPSWTFQICVQPKTMKDCSGTMNVRGGPGGWGNISIIESSKPKFQNAKFKTKFWIKFFFSDAKFCVTRWMRLGVGTVFCSDAKNNTFLMTISSFDSVRQGINKKQNYNLRVTRRRINALFALLVADLPIAEGLSFQIQS